VALTRAQLLQGNSTLGTVIPGVQGVTAGTGIQISNTGVLSINGSDPALTAFIRTNNPLAYNAYVWPGSDGAPGQQLTTDGSGNIDWADADGIPWTLKGQLVVGTGVSTQALLNAGTNTSVLLADATSTNGLVYSNASTAAILAPAGTTAQRPGLPGNPAAVAGQFRFNTQDLVMELYNGVIWVPVGSAIQAGLGINLSGTVPNQVYKASTPIQNGPPAAGTLPAQAIDGSVYWDNNTGLMFVRYNDGSSTQWVQVIPSSGAIAGTVTSVNITGTGGVTAVGGPITSSGTFTVGLDLTSLPLLP